MPIRLVAMTTRRSPLEVRVHRSLSVSPLVDPTLERVGLPLEHPYIEQVWLSVVGPTSVLALRHLGRQLEARPEGVTVDLVDLSRTLGLQAKESVELGRNSQLGRTIERLVQFRFAAWLSEDRLGVHRKVPAVSTHRVERLPESVRADHHALLAEHLDGLARLATSRNCGDRASADDPAPLASSAGRRPVDSRFGQPHGRTDSREHSRARRRKSRSPQIHLGRFP
jgi:hypothetical protein